MQFHQSLSPILPLKILNVVLSPCSLLFLLLCKHWKFFMLAVSNYPLGCSACHKYPSLTGRDINCPVLDSSGMIFGEDPSLGGCSWIKGTGNFFSISLLAVSIRYKKLMAELSRNGAFEVLKYKPRGHICLSLKGLLLHKYDQGPCNAEEN